MKLSNYYKAKLNNKLAVIFTHVYFFLKNLSIRAEYRKELYFGRAEIYIKEMQKEVDNLKF